MHISQIVMLLFIIILMGMLVVVFLMPGKKPCSNSYGCSSSAKFNGCTGGKTKNSGSCEKLEKDKCLADSGCFLTNDTCTNLPAQCSDITKDQQQFCVQKFGCKSDCKESFSPKRSIVSKNRGERFTNRCKL
jgi:hypothetical protein